MRPGLLTEIISQAGGRRQSDRALPDQLNAHCGIGRYFRKDLMDTNSDVFISYASDTKLLAEELIRALEGHGITTWVDFKDLRPGRLFREEVERAIKSASWLLIFVKPNSQATGWQEAEWRAALAHAWTDSRKKLLPVVVGGTEPPPFFRSWIPVRIDPSEEPTTWTDRILEILRSGRSQAAQRSPKDVDEWHQRLAEIRQSAEQLWSQQPDQPPVSSSKN